MHVKVHNLLHRGNSTQDKRPSTELP